MIVVLGGETPGLLERIREVRAAGDAPLVADPRWSRAQREAVTRAAARAGDLPGVAWATLTSGSSASPRIVLRRAASWEESFAAVAEAIAMQEGDVIALPAPPASSLTMFSLAHALGGGPAPALGADALRRDGVTSLHGTPQTLRAALEGDGPLRLRTALVGGSHVNAGLRAQVRDTGIRLVSYYGAAELSFVAIDHGEGLRAFPGVELDVRDGVLWVRSPFTAIGCLGGDGSLRHEGSWATVGDRAELIDGRLRLLGRADDAILSASATIVPEEVEETLRAIPGIRDAVVFGLPRDRVGALVATLIELDEDRPPAGLRDVIADRLAPAHRPRQWFCGELPRTASGKPARAEALRRVIEGEVARYEL
ncbi:class I adenylate-forming enzyme family protein [Microbacterium esteraromaticum]|uniref:class I adenylate-forming enzyme family protein n=1 Tax=Microbacterium esteraromaticum TaxID=57043 RepID=UPI00309CA716